MRVSWYTSEEKKVHGIRLGSEFFIVPFGKIEGEKQAFDAVVHETDYDAQQVLGDQLTELIKKHCLPLNQGEAYRQFLEISGTPYPPVESFQALKQWYAGQWNQRKGEIEIQQLEPQDGPFYNLHEIECIDELLKKYWPHLLESAGQKTFLRGNELVKKLRGERAISSEKAFVHWLQKRKASLVTGKAIDTTQPKGLRQKVIALCHIYQGEQMTKESADEIAVKHGYKNGSKLYQHYKNYIDRNARIATSTDRKNKEHLKLLNEVVEALESNPIAREKAIEERTTFKAAAHLD